MAAQNIYVHFAPRIIHSERRPCCFRQMILDAARNIHLRKQATNLLSFYAGLRHGYCPRLDEITKATGIARQDISKVRKRLMTRGLIDYQPESYVFIDWRHIRILASL
ncbi:MAG: hypothetical protein Q4G00_00685 [Clostridia bacterium]|nr:hypothetical protein [Clostridia bacterium]